MKVKDRYWEAENSIRFANPEKTTRPLLCEPKVSEDGVRIRLWLRNLAEGTGAGGAIVAEGPPEWIAQQGASHTGRALAGAALMLAGMLAAQLIPPDLGSRKKKTG